MTKKSIIFYLILLFSTPIIAQNTLKAVVKDNADHENLVGVTVKLANTTNAALTDINGNVELKKVPNGLQTFIFSSIGYKNLSKSFEFPLNNPEQIITVLMANEDGDLEEVTVTSTRTNSGIEAIATKVEILGLDDMNEENTIKPANIGSILGDLSVIHIQQTSQVNGNSVVRMQGLDGKYTQLLRDGLPLYEGFSGSFGILQIPPLDLKQIEIIKGSVSTLYGGGAISGMINLISKAPTDSTQATVTLNRSTLKETNANAYFSKKIGKIGLTMFVGNTYQDAVDVNNDGFSDVPEVKSTLVHPRFFVYLGPKTHLNAGYSTLFETRTGGDMTVINFKPDSIHTYYEKNITARNSFDANFKQDFSKNQNLNIKGTVSLFNRSIDQSGYLFQGKQVSGFSEASYYASIGKSEIVAGVNYVIEKFTKGITSASLLKDYDYQTFGLFAQESWKLTSIFTTELGLRTDFHNKYGTFILPRIALFYHPNANFSLRLGAGEGYKTPNIFTQQTLAGSFQNLMPIDGTVKAEKSMGINCDINYKTHLGGVSMTLNQAFYYTKISNPILTNPYPIQSSYKGLISLQNALFDVNSIGTDTYLRFQYDDYEFYLGYNHTIARQVGSSDAVYLPFSPQDKFASTFVYEIPDKWRFGIESSYIANQYISLPYGKSPNYLFLAAMIERKFNHVSFVLNCENILDYRQSKHESLFTGTVSNPNFKSLWAPIDGRVTNLSMKIFL